MLKANGKTPVSYLQEQLILKHMCPKYELIFNGVGMQKPKFTFRVQVGDLSEEGTGKNKQEAKHKAAEKMLKTLRLVDYELKQDEEEEEEEEEDQEDYLDPVKNNHIGILKQFCQTHSYPEPVYEEEEAAGPPHSKIFKMACLVSHIRQDGVARTKKAAKHMAAAKMLEQLKQCIKETISPEETVIVPQVIVDTDEVPDKYKSAKTSTSPTVHNPLAFYKDHHNAYLNLREESPTLTKLINAEVEVNNANCVQLAKDIAKELNVKLSMSTNFCTVENKPLVMVSMALTPSICEIGVDYRNAIFKLLNTLLILSQ